MSGKLRILAGTWLLVSFAELPSPADLNAAPIADIRAEQPDLFHPQTGFRIARQRAPTPDDIPGNATIVSADEVASLIDDDAVAIDVFGALQSRYDDLDGTWLVGEKRESIPGAVWLPETGHGTLSDIMEAYLISNLERLTNGNKSRSIVVFCVADCWMSWNAAQRISAYGYTSVHWFPLGTDGWLDSGRTLAPVDPVPVDLE